MKDLAMVAALAPVLFLGYRLVARLDRYPGTDGERDVDGLRTRKARRRMLRRRQRSGCWKRGGPAGSRRI